MILSKEIQYILRDNKENNFYNCKIFNEHCLFLACSHRSGLGGSAFAYVVSRVQCQKAGIIFL